MKVPFGTQSPYLSDSELNPDLVSDPERTYNQRRISLLNERAFAQIVGDIKGERKGQLEERACQSARMLSRPTPGQQWKM
jgi:hypothetical protein